MILCVLYCTRKVVVFNSNTCRWKTAGNCLLNQYSHTIVTQLIFGIFQSNEKLPFILFWVLNLRNPNEINLFVYFLFNSLRLPFYVPVSLLVKLKATSDNKLQGLLTEITYGRSLALSITFLSVELRFRCRDKSSLHVSHISNKLRTLRASCNKLQWQKTAVNDTRSQHQLF